MVVLHVSCRPSKIASGRRRLQQTHCKGLGAAHGGNDLFCISKSSTVETAGKMGKTLIQLLSRTEFIRRKFFPYTYLSRTLQVVERSNFDPSSVSMNQMTGGAKAPACTERAQRKSGTGRKSRAVQSDVADANAPSPHRTSDRVAHRLFVRIISGEALNGNQA